MLLIDTNILLRCSLGRTLTRVDDLRAGGVKLATTDRNVDEFFERLVNKFGRSQESAEAEVLRVLAPIELVPAEEYEHLRGLADARLHDGGKSDWPSLAAALALKGEIWSDYTYYFGVGVPVWSTPNVKFASTADA